MNQFGGNGDRVRTVKWVIMYGNSSVSQLVGVDQRVSQFVAKPKTLVDHQDIHLTIGLVCVRRGRSYDWNVAFSVVRFGIVGGYITNATSKMKGNKICSESTGVSMRVKFTSRCVRR